jgi:hypothetical protein
MKRIMAIAFTITTVAALSSMGGCATLTDTPGANANRVGLTMDTNLRQVPSGAEDVLLLNSPSTLTNAPVPMH